MDRARILQKIEDLKRELANVSDEDKALLIEVLRKIEELETSLNNRISGHGGFRDKLDTHG